MNTRVVYQFPISHFCEKTRWCLDEKGLPYEVRNQLPGIHIPINRWFAGGQTVPILREGKQILGGSTAIAEYLDEQYKERALIPTSDASRTRVLELDAYFNKVFGVEARRYCYGHLVRAGVPIRDVFFPPYGPIARTLGALLLGGILQRALIQMYNLSDEKVHAAEQIMEQGMTRLESELERSGGDYLVDGRLTLADISAASLLAPLVGPANSPWSDVPEAVKTWREARERARARRAGQWVMERYAKDRGRAPRIRSIS